MDTEDYLFEIRFWPAFLGPSCWIVYQQAGVTTLEIQRPSPYGESYISLWSTLSFGPPSNISRRIGW